MTRRISVCGVLWVLLAPAADAQVTSVDGIVIHDRVDVELQQLYVTVTDGRGRRVLDLEKGDFTLLDNGVEQEIVTLGRDVPLTAVLLLDGSASMSGERLAVVLGGARSFVDGMRPLDEAQLLLFSDRLLRVTPCTGRKELLAQLQAGVSWTADGSTAIFDYLYLGLERLEPRQGRRALVLLSDGMDVQSALTAAEVAEVARRSQTVVDWVRLTEGGVGFRRRYPPNPWRHMDQAARELRQLKKTVTASGGRVVTLRRLAEVEPAFRDLLAEIHEQYALGYSPQPRRDDGGWRTVEVRVARPGLRVRSQEGYVDR